MQCAHCRELKPFPLGVVHYYYYGNLNGVKIYAETIADKARIMSEAFFNYASLLVLHVSA